MFRRIAMAAALVFVSGSALASDFYVAPGGTENGDGSMTSPWDLQTALNQPSSVHAGDTIWLRGGTYPGVFTSYLSGTADAPIIVRQYPGERATLDGGSAGQSKVTLAVSGQHAWYWGFEIMSSDTHRLSAQSGSSPTDIYRPDGIQTVQNSTTGPGLKFINLAIHDARQGISFWREAVDAEIYGCLIYYNGWQGPDRGHGHGIYTQNETGTKRIVDNTIFDQFGGGVQAYGSSAAHLNNFWVEGNTNFENGSISTMSASDNLLVGGGVVTDNDTILSNVLYYNAVGDVPTAAFHFGYTAGCTNGTVTGNYVAANSDLSNCAPVSMTGNTYYGTIDGFTESQYPDNTYLSARPTGSKVFIRPNQFEPGRAAITVFNWDREPTIDLDLSAVAYPGGTFQIRNAQDFFGPAVVSGTYAGGTVSVPMGGLSVAAPIGWPAPGRTGPEFNTFVLLSLPTPFDFFDVSPANPFHQAITTLASHGVSSGCGGGNFCPDAFVMRDQMSVFLLKSEHGSTYAPPAASGTVFNDVPSDGFAAAWIEQIAGEGVSTGCGGGLYCPRAAVTRSQMAVFLLKTLLGNSYVPPAATGTVFTDVPADGFAASWIEDLKNRGITAGCGGGHFCPNSKVTRAQMASFLVTTFGLQ